MKKTRTTLRGALVTATALVLFVAVWYTGSMLVSTSSVLPSPSRVLQAAVEMVRSGELQQDVAASLRRVLTGFLLALFLGLVVGVVAARYIRTYRRVAVVLDLLSSIPPIAWTPLAILWFGIGDTPAYFIVFLGAFFPLFTSVYAGIIHTERRLVDAALTLGASGGKVVSGVILPSALPSILTGIRTAVGVGWFNVIAAELIGVRSGLGYKIQLSRTLLFSENVIALMLVIGILGWVMVHLVSGVGNLIAPWRIEDETRPKWIARRDWVARAFWRTEAGPQRDPSRGQEPSYVAPPGERARSEKIRPGDDIPLLSVSGISKSYSIQEGEGTISLGVLQDVSFAVETGEVFTVVGPNGCGKTTLVRLVAGLEGADAGTITFQSRRVTNPSRDRVVIFQDFALFPWLSAGGNIRFALDASGVSRAKRAEVADLLNEAGLHRFGNAYPADLSGGMKQRLAVIRALAVEPTLILMDEPFASLDPLVREKSQEAIRSLIKTRPVTVLLVTHDLDEAIFMSNRVLVLSPRPGRTKSIVPIPLPTGRTVETRKSPEFHAIRNQLWDVLRLPMPDDGNAVCDTSRSML